MRFAALFLILVAGTSFAGERDTQLARLGMCQAVFEVSEGSFDRQLNRISRTIDAFALDASFADDGRQPEDFREAYTANKSRFLAAVASAKADTLKAIPNATDKQLSDALLACRLAHMVIE